MKSGNNVFILIFCLLIQVISANATNSRIRAKISSVFDTHLEGNIGFYIYDIKSDREVFKYEQTGFDIEKPIHIASASKWVTATVIMGLVADGLLSLDSKTKDFLKTEQGENWQSDKGEVTLKELLSFRSGFTETGRQCFVQTNSSLARCVDEFYYDAGFDRSKPFYYGNTHLSIAARMAEVASGKDWNSLFEQYLKDPLSFAKTTYYTNLRDSHINLVNPLVAAGLYISTRDYISFVRMLSHYGYYNGRQIFPGSLIAEMEKRHYLSSAALNSSPMSGLDNRQNVTYGFGNWIECFDSFCKHQKSSSQGAYGFYPVIDRYVGYYAVLSVDSKKLGQGKKVGKIMQKIRPLIEQIVIGER